MSEIHLNKEKGILSLGRIDNFLDIPDWKDYLNSSQREMDIIEDIRANTLTGRPLGSDLFIAKLEEILGRRLRLLQRGRKKQ